MLILKANRRIFLARIYFLCRVYSNLKAYNSQEDAYSSYIASSVRVEVLLTTGTNIVEVGHCRKDIDQHPLSI